MKVGVDELLLLPLELLKAFPLLVDGLNRSRFGLCDLVGREPAFGMPLLQNRRLDFLDTDMGQVAFCATGVTPETKEVLVDTTLAAGLAESHAMAVVPVVFRDSDGIAGATELVDVSFTSATVRDDLWVVFDLGKGLENITVSVESAARLLWQLALVLQDGGR